MALSLGFLDKMQLVGNIIFWIEECEWVLGVSESRLNPCSMCFLWHKSESAWGIMLPGWKLETLQDLKMTLYIN
jgi:hypothetical protein